MTYQRPAYEEVKIAHGGNTVTLRPSLRAAATLEARYGFPAMFRALDQGNLTIIFEIILVSVGSGYQNVAGLHPSSLAIPLSTFFDAVRRPLAELVAMFMPAPVQQLDTRPRTGKPLPWSDYYAALYEQATGWLGWTPEAAWNATPTEIERAFSGHVAKLKAINGSGEDDQQPAQKEHDPEQAARNVADGLDPEFDRAGLNALKMKIAGGA